jgi:hypothetical protein
MFNTFIPQTRLPRVLSLGLPLKFFIDYNKTILGAAPPNATRGRARLENQFTACANRTNILGIIGWKTWVRSSTLLPRFSSAVDRHSAKQPLTHSHVPQLPQFLSPSKTTTSSPIEYYLYPVSTAPINNRNQRKLKKGNK